LYVYKISFEFNLPFDKKLSLGQLFTYRKMKPSWLRPLRLSHLRSIFQFPVLKFRKLSVKSKVFQPPDLNWNTDVYLGIYTVWPKMDWKLPGYATDMDNLCRCNTYCIYAKVEEGGRVRWFLYIVCSLL
jgi:hypothetical protein